MNILSIGNQVITNPGNSQVTHITRRIPLALKLAYTAFMAVLIPVYLYHYGVPEGLMVIAPCFSMGFDVAKEAHVPKGRLKSWLFSVPEHPVTLVLTPPH